MKTAEDVGAKGIWARSLMLAFLSVVVPGSTVFAQSSVLNPLNDIRAADNFLGATLGDQIVKEGAINRTVTISDSQTLRFFAGVRTMHDSRVDGGDLRHGDGIQQRSAGE